MWVYVDVRRFEAHVTSLRDIEWTNKDNEHLNELQIEQIRKMRMNSEQFSFLWRTWGGITRTD